MTKITGNALGFLFILCLVKCCPTLARSISREIKGKRDHQAGAYPGFCSMKRLGVFLLPPGWDASPSQGYPPALNSTSPIHTPRWKEAKSKVSCPRTQHNVPRPGLEPGPLAPKTSALTMRPPRLPWTRETHNFKHKLSNDR